MPARKHTTKPPAALRSSRRPPGVGCSANPPAAAPSGWSASATSALPDPEGRKDQQRHPGSPCDEPLGDRSEMPQRVAAPVVGVIELTHIGDDIGELAVVDPGLAERRHESG